jgi:hypothetical protein
MGLPGELNTKYLRWRGAAILPSHVMLLVTSSMASFGWPLDFLYNFFMSQGMVHQSSIFMFDRSWDGHYEARIHCLA